MNDKKPKKKAKKAAAESDGSEKEHKPNWRETHVSTEDIQKFLNDNVLLRHNVITGQPEFRVPERDEFAALGMRYPTGAVPLDEWRSATQWYGVCDRFVATLYNMLSVGKEVREQDIWRVIKSDFASLYNPFQQYLSRLPPWDEKTNPILELSMRSRATGRCWRTMPRRIQPRSPWRRSWPPMPKMPDYSEDFSCVPHTPIRYA